MNRKQKYQIAKDNNLFGAQLDPKGRLSAKQEDAVDEFIRYCPPEVTNEGV